MEVEEEEEAETGEVNMDKGDKKTRKEEARKVETRKEKTKEEVDKGVWTYVESPEKKKNPTNNKRFTYFVNLVVRVNLGWGPNIYWAQSRRFNVPWPGWPR